MRADRDVVARLRERLEAARKDKDAAEQRCVDLEGQLADERSKIEELAAKITEYGELLDIGPDDEIVPAKRKKATKAEQARRYEAIRAVLASHLGEPVSAEDLRAGVEQELGAEIGARVLKDVLGKHTEQFVQEGKGAWRLATAEHEERPRTGQVDPGSGNGAGVTDQVGR